MLLVADIGNTNIHLGLFDGQNPSESPSRRGLIPVERLDEIARHWAEFAGDQRVEDAIVGSVNPKVGTPFCRWVKRRHGVEPKIFGREVPPPMPVLVDRPSEVGADRLANAVAAFHRLHRACVVVDAGTALTFDVVSEEGAYLGGAIAPGIGTAARALADRTALLPHIRVDPPETAIGKNTIDAMMSGIFYGAVGLVEVMHRRIREERPDDPVFIATGSDGKVLKEHCPLIREFYPDLTLEGLRLAFLAAR